MTSREFEEKLDAWLLALPADRHAPLDIDDLPRPLRALARRSAKARCFVRQRLELHETAASGRPVPPADFADRVIAELAGAAVRGPVGCASKRAPAQRRRFSPWTRIAVMAAALLVAIGLALEPRQVQSPPALARTATPVEATAEPDIPPLGEAIREAGAPYMTLASEVARTIMPPRSVSVVEPAKSNNDTLLPTASLEETFVGPTRTILAGSRGLATPFQPITQSAAGAFAFLWPADSPLERSVAQ